MSCDAHRAFEGVVRPALALLQTLFAALAGMIIAVLVITLLDLAVTGLPPGLLRKGVIAFLGSAAGALALPGDLHRAGLLCPVRPSR